MADTFSVDLPLKFKYTKDTPEEKAEELVIYMEKLHFSIEEMLKRMFRKVVPRSEIEAEVDETKFSHKMPVVMLDGSTKYIMLTDS